MDVDGGIKKKGTKHVRNKTECLTSDWRMKNNWK